MTEYNSSLDIAYLGQPFTNNENNANTNLLSLDIAYLGQPFNEQTLTSVRSNDYDRFLLVF